MKKGLILEGGAMRGMYTAGVLDIFMENDITVDGAIGVSAGAAFGCNLKSKQIGRTIRYNTKYCRDPRYVGLRSLIKTGDITVLIFVIIRFLTALIFLTWKLIRRIQWISTL